MIPNFPEFKKLELSDRNDIEKFTTKFDPYSDFNFIEMWSWNLNGDLEISQLNGNLIIHPNDYFDGEYSLSYLGNNDLPDTLDKLFAYLRLKGIKQPVLRFIPETSLHGIDLARYLIEIDINSCDYIYDVDRTASFAGSEFSDKRRKVNGFLKHNHDPKVVIIDIHNKETRNQVEQLNSLWWENKNGDTEDKFLHKEKLALQRMYDMPNAGTLYSGLYVEGRMYGYSIYSLLPDGYAICHFAKADVENFGVYEYLMKCSAGLLQERGAKLLNYQEDLGLPGLRFFKSSLKPVAFLRKYSISLR